MSHVCTAIPKNLDGPTYLQCMQQGIGLFVFTSQSVNLKRHMASFFGKEAGFI